MEPRPPRGVRTHLDVMLHLAPAVLEVYPCLFLSPAVLTSFPRQRQTLHLLCGSLHLQSHLCLCLGTEGLYLEQQGHAWAGITPGVSPLVEQPSSCWSQARPW